MLAFSIDYYGIFFRATQSVELFCTYRVTLSRPEKGRLILKIKVRMITYLLKIKVRMITYLPKNAGIRSLFEYLRFLFLHIAMQTLFFLFCFLFYNCRIRFFNLCDGCFAHRDTAVFVVSELYDDIIVCDVDDNSVETACRDDCIADCEVIQHCLQFFLLFLLRTDH